MKKTLVVLLILAVAGGVFAQEVTWSGSIDTGAVIGIVKDQDDVFIKADDDDVGTGVKTRLNVAVTDDAWGLEMGIKADIGTDGAALTENAWTNDYYIGLQFYNAHGWILFADMIKVRAGLIDPGVWTTQGPNDWNLSSAAGIRIEVMPIEGLNVGAFLNWGDGRDGRVIPMTIGNFFKETTLGFSYSNPDMMGLYAAIAFKLDGKDDESTMILPDGDDDKNAELIFGFGISPMEALTVKLEGHVYRLGEYSDAGFMWLVEDISYQVMEPLKVGLEAQQQIAGDDSVPISGDFINKTYLKFKLYGEYAVNETISAGLDIPMEMMKNSDDDLAFATFGMNLWGKYTVGGASMKVGYGFTKKTEDFGDSLSHYIRLLFSYSF